MTARAYTAVYGGFDRQQPQPVPVEVITEATHPLPHADPRLAAKWWKMRPDLALPGAEVTVWMDGNQVALRPTFLAEMEELLGGADVLLFRHETRSDVREEVIASRRGEKYDRMPLEEQALEYEIAGHPRGWGLAHACCIVRRDNERTREFGRRWWAEVERWSVQDQVSLPFVLRGMPELRVAWAPGPVAQWLGQTWHTGRDSWRRWAKPPIRHFVLTRSAYSPDFPIEANRLRLELLRRVAAPSLAAQSERDVTWLVMTDPADPLLDERVAALESSGLPVRTADAGRMVRTGGSDLPQAQWARAIGRSASHATVTTRFDDDDALAPWALSAARLVAEGHNVRSRGGRIVATLPAGWRVVGGRADLFDAPRMMNWDEGVPWVSQYSTLYAPPGDIKTMLDVRHGAAHRLGPLVEVTKRPAWLWLRHAEARSNYTRHSRDQRDSMPPVTPELRAEFPIDWDFVESLDPG